MPRPLGLAAKLSYRCYSHMFDAQCQPGIVIHSQRECTAVWFEGTIFSLCRCRCVLGNENSKYSSAWGKRMKRTEVCTGKGWLVWKSAARTGQSFQQCSH